MVNADKPDKWDSDSQISVDQYNAWYMNFAPEAYRSTYNSCFQSVDELFRLSSNLRSLTPSLLNKKPDTLAALRMSCTPPIARERLAGLANVSVGLVKRLEDGKAAMSSNQLPSILKVIARLLDRQLMPWLDGQCEPMQSDLTFARSIITDRLCGTSANPVIRNEQEHRQFSVIEDYLKPRGYTFCTKISDSIFNMQPGTYGFHKNVSMYKNSRDESGGLVNTPIDMVIMPRNSSAQYPILVECKSAGDFTNTNKRRKEETEKNAQLRGTYGDEMSLYLFLGGYFNESYLSYLASNNMDWIWEHRVEDFELIGL